MGMLINTTPWPQLSLSALSPRDNFLHGNHHGGMFSVRGGDMCPKHTPSWIADGFWHVERLAPGQQKPAAEIRSMSGIFEAGRPGGRMKLR